MALRVSRFSRKESSPQFAELRADDASNNARGVGPGDSAALSGVVPSMIGGDGKEIYRGWTIVVKVGAWPHGNELTSALYRPWLLCHRTRSSSVSSMWVEAPHSCYAPMRFVMGLPSQGPLSTCRCGHRTLRVSR